MVKCFFCNNYYKHNRSCFRKRFISSDIFKYEILPHIRYYNLVVTLSKELIKLIKILYKLNIVPSWNTNSPIVVPLEYVQKFKKYQIQTQSFTLYRKRRKNIPFIIVRFYQNIIDFIQFNYRRQDNLYYKFFRIQGGTFITKYNTTEIPEEYINKNLKRIYQIFNRLCIFQSVPSGFN